MTDKKTVKKKKHVSFPQQREQCRLNKFTYIEKVGSLKEPVLFCNYPFPDPTHKKGLCKANLCTDMREIPDDITAADDKETTEATEPVEHKGEAGDNLSDEAMDEAANIDAETQTFDDAAEAVTKEMGADGPEGSMASEEAGIKLPEDDGHVPGENDTTRAGHQ